MNLIKLYNIRNEEELEELIRRRQAKKSQNIHVYHHANKSNMHVKRQPIKRPVANSSTYSHVVQPPNNSKSIKLRYRTTAPRINLKSHVIHRNGTGNFVFKLQKPQLQFKSKPSSRNGIFMSKKRYSSKKKNIENAEKLLRVSNINNNIRNQALNNLKK